MQHFGLSSLSFLRSKSCSMIFHDEVFFLLDAAWVRSQAERPSVSSTKVTRKVAWTGHNLQFTKTNSNNKLAAATNSEKGGRESETDARAVRLEAHRMSVVQHCARVNLHGRREARNK